MKFTFCHSCTPESHPSCPGMTPDVCVCLRTVCQKCDLCSAILSSKLCLARPQAMLPQMLSRNDSHLYFSRLIAATNDSHVYFLDLPDRCAGRSDLDTPSKERRLPGSPAETLAKTFCLYQPRHPSCPRMILHVSSRIMCSPVSHRGVCKSPVFTLAPQLPGDASPCVD